MADSECKPVGSALFNSERHFLGLPKLLYFWLEYRKLVGLGVSRLDRGGVYDYHLVVFGLWRELVRLLRPDVLLCKRNNRIVAGLELRHQLLCYPACRFVEILI